MAIKTYDCSHAVEIDAEPRHHLVISNEFVRAFAVEIAPGERTLCHRHPHDYLLYVAGAASIISAARNEEPRRLKYDDGECELSAAGLTHVVENLGADPFRNVVVEMLPAAGKLRRGAQPCGMGGDTRTDSILEEEPGAVYRLTMQPGSEIEVAGPAVLASPYDDAVIAKELDDYDIPLNSFGKLMWVCAPRKLAIKNVGPATARAIAFQIGKGK